MSAFHDTWLLRVLGSAIPLVALVAGCGSGGSGDQSPSGVRSNASEHDASTAACVEATAGASCVPTVSAACNQPSNPCGAGYVWACDNSSGTWIEETITCYTDAAQTTRTTATCGVGQALFVDDAAGDPCVSPGDGGTCGEGGYLFEPGCCYYPTDAYCVAVSPECSGGALDCSCASPVCEAQCSGGSGQNPAVTCSAASSGVIDCLCGKL